MQCNHGGLFIVTEIVAHSTPVNLLHTNKHTAKGIGAKNNTACSVYGESIIVCSRFAQRPHIYSVRESDVYGESTKKFRRCLSYNKHRHVFTNSVCNDCD